MQPIDSLSIDIVDDEMVRVIMHMKEGGIKESFVDIRNNACSCRVFQVDQFVCAHAIVVCLYL